MTLITEAKARNAHWQHQIDQWQTSGLSGTDYCRQHALTYHCFIYWRRKLANAMTERSDETEADGQAPSAFVAVRPQPLSGLAQVSGDDLHLRLPNGLEIRNIHDNNLSNVRSLLAHL